MASNLAGPMYDSPMRLARRLKLNTIIEDEPPQQEQGYPLQRRRRNTDVSPGSCYSRQSASTISSYYEGSRDSQTFDDLYDISGSESDGEIHTPKINIKRASTGSSLSGASTPSRNRYPALVIPSPRLWPTIENFKKNSPIPPTPPAKIPISPHILSRYVPAAPSSSATPSLDGSLSSDQHAVYSAPPTPDIPHNPADSVDWNRVKIIRGSEEFAEESGPTIEVGLDLRDARNFGVQLPEEALATLRHLSVDQATEPPPSRREGESTEMQEVACIMRTPHNDAPEPISATSEYSISQLSIPSPGGFFSSLDASSRSTWTNSLDPADLPPSSTTAEHFYSAPWNKPVTNVVEQSITIDDTTTEGPPTAVRLLESPLPSGTSQLSRDRERDSPVPDVEHSRQDGTNALEELDRQLYNAVESAFDRTTSWAAAQSSYLATLAGTNTVNITDSNLHPSRSPSPGAASDSEVLVGRLKKVVKFLDTNAANAAVKPSAAQKSGDSLFYQAFQTLSNQSSPTDSFVHRHTRFDAIQALRASLRHTHIDHLLGHYETVEASRPAPQRPISMMPGKADDTATPEQEAIVQLERERQAHEQVAPAMWIVEAMRFLAGGRLLNSPAADVLARAPPLENATPPEHIRVLDLGGQPQCDWAWHCAREYPNVKTYTATCDARSVNHTLRGPSNHRLVTVDNLFCLPFSDNHFDVISARSLPMFLRNEKPFGQARDEYDRCLRECLRCLKPGGYLEFFILDSEIVLAGSRGSAASVEFGFNLRARGYDPAPTKSWLARARRGGFVDIKRAWMFLPMGAIREGDGGTESLPETPPPNRDSSYEANLAKAEAVQGPVGSKADAAHISGLVGSCLWEKWLLKLQMEMGKEVGLLDGVGAVVEEGKRTGAGWRCMSGWAKKPL